MPEPFDRFQSRILCLLVDDIDTDQILPARFLKTTVRKGLGRHLFADWCYEPDGTDKPDSIFNARAGRGAQILLAGKNFGCGSSREHAVWALRDWGIRAVLST